MILMIPRFMRRVLRLFSDGLEEAGFETSVAIFEFPYFLLDLALQGQENSLKDDVCIPCRAIIPRRNSGAD